MLWAVEEEVAAQGMRTEWGRGMGNAVGETSEMDLCS